ncbi:hypothetical protein [Leisingera sp.]|uniref:hypothetical protein n=1 Tax=Leisingera sp. TaxID=1879318 RepID=UPI002B270DFE|nr:hypothetical protein [Leisingera sp.]
MPEEEIQSDRKPGAGEAKRPLPSVYEIAEIIAAHAGSHALLFEDAAQEILDRLEEDT